MSQKAAHKILVAEDEMVIAYDLCETVEEAGFQVEGPHSGISAAMFAFQKEKPDLAILDISLEDGNVFSLAEKLDAEHVPIIFHSGRHSPEEVRERFPSAITLLKPCPPADMLKAVNDVLQDCGAKRD